MTTALFTHHHFGWERHDLPDASEENLLAALLETHDFLQEFEGSYRMEIERDCECAGSVHIIWDGQEAKEQVFGPAIYPGELWFKAFVFNVAQADACRYCGGSGVDHYTGPFNCCWACDGTGAKVRDSRPRDFKYRKRTWNSYPSYFQDTG